MAMRLEWKDPKSKEWVAIDWKRYDSLNPKHKYRIFEAGRWNISFNGDLWDKSVMDDEEALSYWWAYNGGVLLPYMDKDQYYQGRMDKEASTEYEQQDEDIQLYFDDEDDDFGR